MTEQGVQEEAPDMFSDMLAFPSSKARSPQDFVIKFSGSGDLKASVTRPSGIEDDAEVVETGRSTICGSSPTVFEVFELFIAFLFRINSLFIPILKYFLHIGKPDIL